MLDPENTEAIRILAVKLKGGYTQMGKTEFGLLRLEKDTKEVKDELLAYCPLSYV